MPDYIPDRMPESVPNGMPHQMPEFVRDRMPEYMQVSTQDKHVFGDVEAIPVPVTSRV